MSSHGLIRVQRFNPASVESQPAESAKNHSQSLGSKRAHNDLESSASAATGRGDNAAPSTSHKDASHKDKDKFKVKKVKHAEPEENEYEEDEMSSWDKKEKKEKKDKKEKKEEQSRESEASDEYDAKDSNASKAKNVVRETQLKNAEQEQAVEALLNEMDDSYQLTEGAEMKSKKRNAKKKHKTFYAVEKHPALDYLKEWKAWYDYEHLSESKKAKRVKPVWKFNKTRQIYLLQYYYDWVKIPDEDFEILVEYMKTVQGSARNTTLEEAKVILSEAEAFKEEHDMMMARAEARQRQLDFIRARRKLKDLRKGKGKKKYEYESDDSNSNSGNETDNDGGSNTDDGSNDDSDSDNDAEHKTRNRKTSKDEKKKSSKDKKEFELPDISDIDPALLAPLPKNMKVQPIKRNPNQATSPEEMRKSPTSLARSKIVIDLYSAQQENASNCSGSSSSSNKRDSSKK